MVKTKKEFSIRDLILMAVFTALLCVIAPVTVKSQTEFPVTLGTFMFCFTAAALGLKRGTVCTVLYLVLGALGVPVFAGWTGGYDRFGGNSGGYLIGFLLLTVAVGWIVDANNRNAYLYFVGMIVGVALCLACGALFLAIKSHWHFTEIWSRGVYPYLSFECIKIFCAAMLAYPLRKLVKKISGA